MENKCLVIKRGMSAIVRYTPVSKYWHYRLLLTSVVPIVVPNSTTLFLTFSTSFYCSAWNCS
jgi:hypothetical protein